MPRFRGRRPDDEPPAPPDGAGWKSERAAQLAAERHALNVLISEFDWHRCHEAAKTEGLDSISELVRRALGAYLDSHESAELFAWSSYEAIELEAQRRERREAERRRRQAVVARTGTDDHGAPGG